MLQTLLLDQLKTFGQLPWEFKDLGICLLFHCKSSHISCLHYILVHVNRDTHTHTHIYIVRDKTECMSYILHTMTMYSIYVTEIIPPTSLPVGIVEVTLFITIREIGIC